MTSPESRAVRRNDVTNAPLLCVQTCTRCRHLCHACCACKAVPVHNDVTYAPRIGCACKAVRNDVTYAPRVVPAKLYAMTSPMPQVLCVESCTQLCHQCPKCSACKAVRNYVTQAPSVVRAKLYAIMSPMPQVLCVQSCMQ